MGTGTDKCCVYIFEQAGSDIIKIGISGQPDVRLRQVVNTSGFNCSLIQAFRYPSRDEAYEVEQSLHKKYRKYRKKGEWFDKVVLGEMSSSDFDSKNTTPWGDYVKFKNKVKARNEPEPEIKASAPLVIKQPISEYPEMNLAEDRQPIRDESYSLSSVALKGIVFIGMVYMIYTLAYSPVRVLGL